MADNSMWELKPLPLRVYELRNPNGKVMARLSLSKGVPLEVALFQLKRITNAMNLTGKTKISVE